jgi:hypothetical protein
MDTFFYIFASAMLAGIYASIMSIQKSISKIEKSLAARDAQ